MFPWFRYKNRSLGGGSWWEQVLIGDCWWASHPLMSAIIQQTCEDNLVDYSLISWAEDFSTLFVFILVSLCSNQLDKTANKFGHNGSSQCKIVPRGTLLLILQTVEMWGRASSINLNLNLNFNLLFKTRWRLTTLPQLTTKQMFSRPYHPKEKIKRKKKKKIKLHQYPTLAVWSARIVIDYLCSCVLSILLFKSVCTIVE